MLSVFFTSGDIFQDGVETGWQKWEKAGDDAATVDATGYSGNATNSAYFVRVVEVFQP